MKAKNVVIINTHDTGTFLSPYGYNVPSDNLLDFCEDALLFRNAFCASPTCSPSRASMLTGSYPHTNGMLTLSHRGTSIVDMDRHLCRYLRNHGFHTALCGIQHEHKFWRPYELGMEASREIGYQDNITSSLEGVTDDTKLLEWDYRNAQNVADYIQKYDKEEPFFISYGMQATHRIYPELTEEDQIDVDHIKVPDNVADNPENRYDTACLHKSIKSFDKCFQTVRDAMIESGHYDDTMLIYVTDHGLANPFSKCNLYDDGIKTSLIMHVPGYEESYGKAYEGLVSQIDIYPTICEWLGLKIPEWVQGTSFLSAFDNQQEEINQEVYAEVNLHASYEPQRCIRTKRYKYICYYDPTWDKVNLANIDDSVPKSFLLAHGLREHRKEKEQLYDLYYDPHERNNLVHDSRYNKVLEDMRKKLSDWRKKTKDHIIDFSEYQGIMKVNKKESEHASSKDMNDYESLIK